MECGIGDSYYQQEKTDVETFTFLTILGMDYAATILLMLFAVVAKRHAERIMEKIKLAAQRVRAGKRLAQLMQHEDIKAELKAFFVSLDADGSGTLDADEWSKGVTANPALMSRYFGDITVEEQLAMFAQMDTDGSGDLSWDEFVAGAQQFEPKAAAPKKVQYRWF